MFKLLVTGGSGFIGKAVCENLKKDYKINITSRRDDAINLSGVKVYNINEINENTNWFKALNKVSCVIHCAAKTHVMNNIKQKSLNSFIEVNVEGTLNLARQAAECGVKRFIFLSSIKVNGERTEKSSMFRYNDVPKPEDPYGISKWEAEKGLWKISKQTGLEVVIIRAPLVCGPGVKGNLKRLIKLIQYEFLYHSVLLKIKDP